MLIDFRKFVLIYVHTVVGYLHRYERFQQEIVRKIRNNPKMKDLSLQQNQITPLLASLRDGSKSKRSVNNNKIHFIRSPLP